MGDPCLSGHVIRLSVTLGLLATLFACRERRPEEPAEPVPGYQSAQAGRDCGPAGGAAVTVVLRPEAAEFDALGPQLRIVVWRSLEDVDGKTFTSADRPPTGGGLECGGPESCQPLLAWRIRFTGVAADSSVTGYVEAATAGGPTRQGTFSASWHSRTVYCI
jgi:hypothetical protein